MGKLRLTKLQTFLRSGAVLSIFIVCGIQGCSPSSAGKSVGKTSCTPTESRPEFIVATLNIHAGVGIDGKRDLGRIATTLKGVDFVGMQEVDHDRIRTGISNQVRVIANKLGHSYWEHFPAEKNWLMGAYGNAVSSFFPVLDSGMFDLPVIEGKPLRKLAWIKFLVDCRPINAFIIHITNTENEKTRWGQIEAAVKLVNKMIGKTGEPIIFMGDFNSPPNSVNIQKLRKQFTDSVLENSLKNGLQRQVDYVFVKGELDIVNVVLKKNSASDHPAIFVTLR